MGLASYQVAAATLFVSGIAWLWYRWRAERWAEGVARTLLDGRRALYTEIPEHRALSDGEAVEKRQRLDPTSDALARFRRVADYVDVYPPESRFCVLDPEPIRVLVDTEGTTVAMVFRSANGILRIHLATELGGGGWILTENNEKEMHDQRPEGFHVARVRKDASPAAIAAHHDERLAEVMGGTIGAVPVRTFADFVASHERRWNAIRAHRRSIGWVLPSEVNYAPGTSPKDKERVYREIRRIVTSSDDTT